VQLAVAPTVPEHVSWASHTPLGAPPHAVPGVTAASTPHVALVPEHASATSHAPTDGRHTVLVPSRTSAGQLVVEPVQFSATSHAPPLGRQTTEDGW
jgi:hypothetical protein